jgi:glycosyltransferase involved in cell wall biosynthesis
MDERPLAIVMCTWQRLAKLPQTLDLLAQQTDQNFTFYIWNNNVEIASDVERYVTQATLPVNVRHSEANIGGFGRFYYAHELRTQGYPYVIFIDDDQIFDTDMVKNFRTEACPDIFTGWWAWHFVAHGSYWLRRRVKRTGEAAHYVGTCGMIMDTTLFEHEDFFTDCPEKYRLGIEDLWLSYYAHHILGWHLSKSKVKFKAQLDSHGAVLQAWDKKTAFLNYLRKQGWGV